MPSNTLHYDMTMFGAGDAFLASLDRRRMTIIDNQFTIQTDLIGEGVISGWTVTATSGAGIRISPGVGIIERLVTQTFGDIDVTLQDRPRYYIYMRRKPEVIADLSAFSLLSTVEYLDSDPPAAPTGLTLEDTDYNFIELSWDANAEGDLDYYELYRKLTTDSTYDLLTTLTDTTYLDEEVEENTSYDYKLVAVDINGLSSPDSTPLTVSTDQDVRVPDDPSNLFVVNGDETLQLVWDAAHFLIDTYELTVQPIDTQGAPDGAATVYTYDSSKLSVILQGLENGQFYDLTLKSVSVNNIKSTGVKVRGQPVYSFGVPQFASFNITETVIDASYNLMLRLTWTLQDGDEYGSEYLPDPAYYLITVFSNENNPEASYYSGTPAIISSYTIGTDDVLPIREDTQYTIQVQSVTTDGLISQAYVIRHHTSKYSPPLPVTSFDVTGEYSRTARSVQATWVNSTSAFSYNELTVIKTPLATELDPNPTPVTLVDARNIGDAQSYSLAKSLVANNAIYAFSLKVYDQFGNSSTLESDTVILNTDLGGTGAQGEDEIPEVRPPVPEQMTAISGNDMVTMYWTRVESDFIDGYTIWRAELPGRPIIPEDWEEMGVVSGTTHKYTDYTAENGKKYFYFVTSIDVFGKRSPNPEDDDYFGYVLTPGEPRGHTDMLKASPLTVSEDLSFPHDWVITWTGDDDSFDGFQIFRSYNNEPFVQIGSVDSFETEYRDVGGRWKSGTYRFMTRKFRNEGEVIASPTEIAPVGAIPIALVTLLSGTVNTITENARNIDLMRDPTRDEVETQLQAKTHIWHNVGDDRRIRLAETLTIDDWTADEDFQIYTTQYDTRGGGTYYVYLDGVQSPFSAVLDRTSGTLTFETSIFDPNDDPEATAPSVSVVILGTGEVEGVLPSEHMGEIIASKIRKGKLPLETLTQIDHFGRFRERCVSKRYPASRDSAHVYSGTTPAGTTFYDVVKTPDDRLLAATSDGLKLTLTDDGSRWTTVLTTSLPCTMVLKAAQHSGWYFAVAGNKVYYTEDLELWTEILGTDGVSVIRDIVENDDGLIFISSDAGVYRLDPDQFTKLYWDQVSPLDNLDPGAYGMFYDSTDAILLASGTEGIYESTDDGDTWTKVSGIQVASPVFSIIRVDGFHFLASENKVFRRIAGDTVFRVIATLTMACRKLAFFGEDLYLTSDAGLLRTESDVDIYTEINLHFVTAFKHLVRNGILPVTFALREIDGRLWLGQDERVYSVTSRLQTLLNGEIASTVATIYLNNRERSVGVFYGSNNKILFDTKRQTTDVVEVVKDYTEYFLVNGGWVETKYDANIVLNINGVDQRSTADVHVSNKASDVASSVQAIVLPFFSPRNANFNEAFKYYKKTIQLADAISTDALLTPSMVITPERVAELFESINLMKNNLDPDVQEGVVFPKMGGSVTTLSGINYDYDAVTGGFIIYTGASKYSRVAVSVEGTGIKNIGIFTHKEIDDTFEQINSGLSSSLAAVQQSNIVKLGLFSEREQPDHLFDRGLVYQARFSNPCDASWYDTLKSTVDNVQEFEQTPLRQVQNGRVTYGSFSIEYPADVLYVQDRGEVWVCGAGGVIAVDTTTFECTKIIQTEFYFYNMHLSDGIVYTLAEDGLYTVDTDTLEVTLEVDVELPPNYNSILHFGDTNFVATKDGLYARRPFEPVWKQILSVNNPFVRATPTLNFCVGQDPVDESGETYIVYYSVAGAVWNRSNQFTGYVISGAAKRYDAIYYATDHGLLIEDLGQLFGGGVSTLQAADLDGDEEGDDVGINAVDADNDVVIVARDDGGFYTSSGGAWTEHTSLFSTIHKVKAVEGQYWLFANSQVQVQGESRVIELTTGKALA